MMAKKCLPILFWLYAALSLYAQTDSADEKTAEPDAPVLSLPDMGEEVLGLENRGITVPPPPLPPLVLPESSLPLPETGDVSIPESAYKTAAAADAEIQQELGESLNEASIGAALWNGISANLSIYRPGRNPSYSLMFSHDSRDGLAFHDSGSGYSSRKTALQGRIRGSGDVSAWSLGASFSDEAKGLQGRSDDFYGINHRYIDIEGAFSRPLGPLLLRTRLNAGSAGLSLERSRSPLSGSTESRELSIVPWFALVWEKERLSLGLESDFSFLGLLNNPDGVEQDERYSYHLGGLLSAGFEYSPFLSFGASAGFVSSPDIPVLFPFSLWLSAGILDTASLHISGGLKAEQLSLASAWRLNPFLDVGPVLADDSRWYTDLSTDIFLVQDLTLRINAAWSMSVDGGGRIAPIAPSAVHNPGRYLYGYTSEEYTCFNTDVSLHKWFGPVFFSVGWAMDWIDPPLIGKQSRIRGELEFRQSRERCGASLTG
ncbi:hypothetical protein LJC14_04845, partial [Treponema sp. OttesenSCG-928-L16]|nr:hypothetical protein [Treponema sp. OttesenSCG-928-L16]